MHTLLRTSISICKRFLPHAVLFIAIIVVAYAISDLVLATPCTYAQSNCPQPAVVGRQPLPSEIDDFFDLAGINELGAQGTALPKITKGRAPNVVAAEPYVPCVLLKAIGWVESNGWLQFNADYGDAGPTVIAPDCGYGIMQITSGMDGTGGFVPSRVASSAPYNIGVGTKILIEKWNSNIPPIGDNNPKFIENWYYAIWAYNSFGFVNNPNNPNFLDDRISWVCNNSQESDLWPYQEKVLGCIQFPPSDPTAITEPGDPRVPVWRPILVSLPPIESITRPPGPIDSPTPLHTSCTEIFLPIVVGPEDETS